MAASPSLMEPSSEADKLSYEIFTILETKFLFGYNEPKLFLPESSPEIPSKKPSGRERASSPGKVCILSIDASNDCLLAAASLAHLESSLQRLSGDPAGRIADFFDIAAGSGTGGVLAALLFTRGPDGRPISADDALCFLLKTGALCDSAGERKGFFRRMFRRSGSSNFRKVFGKLTLRDTMKPVLIPCYDLTTGAPFLFSRADAVEADTYDFLIREVCAATCAGRVASEMKSIDSRARIAAVGGGLAMPNPAAAAITHVLHNKQEFPFAAGVDDLIVVSLGSGEQDIAVGCASPSTDEVVRIAANGMVDVVDQAIAMAFKQHRKSNYVRIQATGPVLRSPKCTKTVNSNTKKMRIEEMLCQRNNESVLFHGRKLSKETNAEMLEGLAVELIKEQDNRSKSSVPTVFIKQALTPRTSSATTATASTTTTSTRSLCSP